MTGWIKLHRNIKDHWVFQDMKYYYWWTTILLSVNHSPSKFPVGDELFDCNSGQSFRSFESWGILLKCSKGTVIKFFNLLEKDNMISMEIVGRGNRRKLLLTVVKWSKYQEIKTEVDVINKPETEPKADLEMTPNKNVNNKENEKKEKDNILCDSVFDFYATTCSGFRQVVDRSDKRKKAILARTKEHGIETVMAVIKRASASDFLNGKSKQGWKANFDWVFKPDKFINILEGNHDNKSGYYENPAPPQKQKELSSDGSRIKLPVPLTSYRP